MKHAVLLVAIAACSSVFPNTSEVESSATISSAWAGGGTTGTVDRTITLTPAANTLLVAFASVSGNTQTAPAMTDNQGGTYTLVGHADWNTSTNTMFAFVRNSLVSSAVSTVITLDTDTNTAAELVVTSATGMTKTGASAIKQIVVGSNQTAVTDPSVTFAASVNTNNPTITAVASADTNSIQASGWTERKDAAQTSPTTVLEVATRNSGFSGTTITYAATTDTSYAVMGLELDYYVPPPPVDAGVDSSPDASHDAAVVDASTVDAGPIVFAHGMDEQVCCSSVNPSTITRDTQTSGSTFILVAGGNTSDVSHTPTDSKSNTYSLLGGNDYTNWAGSGVHAWASKNAIGGTSTSWHQYVTPNSENAIFAIEVPGAGTNPTIITSETQQDNSGAYLNYIDGYLQCPGDAAGTHHCVDLTSGSVTTTGPATLIAYWWGAGATQYGNHVMWANNGFTILDSYGIDNANGLVQGAMAYKTVTSAGTYNVTWTYKPPQGAILWLIAVQP